MNLEKIKRDTKEMVITVYKVSTKKENLPYTIAGLVGLGLFNVIGAAIGVGGVYLFKKNKKK